MSINLRKIEIMQAIKKQIVTDEAFQPVAVIINYQDWQRIEAILQQVELSEPIEGGSDISKILMSYAGSLSLGVDPLEYQKSIRDEWQ